MFLTPLKHEKPMDLTEDGRFISLNDIHPSKTLFPIDSTEEGIIICFNDEQFLNAQFPIDVNFDGFMNVTLNKDVQPSNELFSIDVT